MRLPWSTDLCFFTVDFNTSLAVYLTNVPTLENFRVDLVFLRFDRNLVLTSGSVQRTFHVAHSCDEYPCFRGRSAVSAGIPSTVLTLLDSAETLVSGEPPEHLCIFVSLLSCLSQSVFGTIQRRLACPCAVLDTHQSRTAVKFLCCTASANFFLFSSEGI